MDKQVTVAIINHNTRDFLKDCIHSIQEEGLKSQITVVDNASTDGSQAMVASEFPEIVLIQNEQNIGYSRAVNQVLSEKKQGYVFLLNSDTKLTKDCLVNLFNYMKNNLQVGAVGPKIINTDGTIQHSRRHFPSFIDATFHAFLGNILPKNPFTKRYKMVDQELSKSFAVDWVSGAAMFIRLQAAKDVGLFDEGYFMFVEDTDFCYQLWEKGWEVHFYPDAEVLHHIGQSTSQNPVPNIIAHQKSIWRFYRKNKTGLIDRLLLPLVGAGLLARTVILVMVKVIFRK